MYDLANFVKSARKQSGLTQEELALELGLAGKGTVSAWEKGTNKPSFDTMLQIAKLCGVDLPYQKQNFDHNNKDGYITFAVLDVTASLGTGASGNQELEIVDLVHISEEWAYENIGKNLKNIAVISASGDSMAGTIENGDILFVDSSVQRYESEGLYIIYTPSGLKAKRLLLSANGKTLFVISDNPKYPREEYGEAEFADIRICGKIKAMWKFHSFEK